MARRASLDTVERPRLAGAEPTRRFQPVEPWSAAMQVASLLGTTACPRGRPLPAPRGGVRSLAALHHVADDAGAVAHGARRDVFRLAGSPVALARQAAPAVAEGGAQERASAVASGAMHGTASATAQSPASARCRRTSGSRARGGTTGPSTSSTRAFCCSSSGGTTPRPAFAASPRSTSARSNSRAARCSTSSRPPTSS